MGVNGRLLSGQTVRQDAGKIGNQQEAGIIGCPFGFRHIVHGDGHGDSTAFGVDDCDFGAQGVERASLVGDNHSGQVAAYAV